MKIHTLNLGRLRNEELCQFQTDLHSLLKNSEPVKTGLGDALYGEFNRLRSPTIAAPQVNTLGLNAWVDALANINNRFVADLAARYAETAAQPAAGAMRDLRPAIEQNLRALFEKVNALLLTAPDAAAAAVIDTFIAALNARIDYYARAAARHGKRKTHDDQPNPGAPDADADGGDEAGAGNGEAEITIPVPLEVDVTATARAKKT
jgi:hypothetical protein